MCVCVNIIGEELFHSKNKITINKRCDIQVTVSTDSMSEWGAEQSWTVTEHLE